MAMFEGFAHGRHDTGAATIDYVTGGTGPALLLLHGFPQTKAMWAHIAPVLARQFKVVAADLRGYGESSRPENGSDCSAYSFRAMAADMVSLMAALGHERFHLVGHDRGGRTAHRLTLDHPDAVRSLTVMDIVPTRIVFAEGEEPSVVRAAYSFKNQGLGHPILIGREAQVEATMELMGVPAGSLEILNARLSDNNPVYTDMLYARLQREGYLKRDVQRLVNQDRNVFGCCMLKNGDADGMVTGVTRNYDVALNDALMVLDPLPGQAVIGMSMVINRGKTVFIADTSVTELPQGPQLAKIAIEAARAVNAVGFTPRVAFLSYSTFGNPMGERGEKVRDAVAILDRMTGIDFEYEGDMNADVALNPNHRLLYPFSRLSGPANVLVMPAIHAASISTKLLESMSRATVIGPMLLGLEKPVQIASLGATVGDIVNLATIAAYDVDRVHG